MTKELFSPEEAHNECICLNQSQYYQWFTHEHVEVTHLIRRQEVSWVEQNITKSVLFPFGFAVPEEFWPMLTKLQDLAYIDEVIKITRNW